MDVRTESDDLHRLFILIEEKHRAQIISVSFLKLNHTPMIAQHSDQESEIRQPPEALLEC